jgi:hypothetical protein
LHRQQHQSQTPRPFTLLVTIAVGRHASAHHAATAFPVPAIAATAALQHSATSSNISSIAYHHASAPAGGTSTSTPGTARPLSRRQVGARARRAPSPRTASSQQQYTTVAPSATATALTVGLPPHATHALTGISVSAYHSRCPRPHVSLQPPRLPSRTTPASAFSHITPPAATTALQHRQRHIISASSTLQSRGARSLLGFGFRASPLLPSRSNRVSIAILLATFAFACAASASRRSSKLPRLNLAVLILISHFVYRWAALPRRNVLRASHACAGRGVGPGALISLGPMAAASLHDCASGYTVLPATPTATTSTRSPSAEIRHQHSELGLWRSILATLQLHPALALCTLHLHSRSNAGVHALAPAGVVEVAFRARAAYISSTTSSTCSHHPTTCSHHPATYSPTIPQLIFP